MKKIMQFSLLATVCSFSHEALAQCLVRTTNPQDIIMNVGRVLITPYSQVGDVLATGTFDIRENTSISCRGISTMYGRIMQGSPSALSDKIWTTNIAGVGIRLYRQIGSTQSAYYPHDLTVNGSARLAEGYFKVEIIKIAANTGSGPIAPGQYSTYYADGTGQTLPILTSRVLANSITIVTSSCAVENESKDKIVNLPTVTAASFTGIGSTQGEKDFDLKLRCNGGVGTEYLSNANGEIKIGFNYTPVATALSAGVIRTLQDSSAATGVGIQLLHATTSTPIKSGDKVIAGYTLPNQNNSLVLPLKARYYQTTNQVTAGVVKAIATFTIEYN
jgi:type 1 fimbria pilin